MQRAARSGSQQDSGISHLMMRMSELTSNAATALRGARC